MEDEETLETEVGGNKDPLVTRQNTVMSSKT